ncbi:MAG: GTP-binding protein [Firmicutes bacterium]|nr:GTP-binding protein [Bacillota bacterium]
MTKVDIVSGFLGAGKTTFIKEMIAKVYKGQRVVLIENEFGEIGIDSGFMKNAGIEVTEMNSGCICCTLVGDFARSLKQVVEQFKPERVVIEPSGVGKLSDVAAAVADVSEEAGVEINSRIAVVDGKKAKMYMKNFGEFYNNQIESATTIVISRTQNMDEAKLKECIELIREKNSEASIITTPWDKLEGAAIEGAISHGYDLEKELMEEYRHAHHHDHDHDHGDDCTCGCHNHDHEHDHHHHHHHADEVFDSWGVETVHVFTRSGLEDIMGLFSTTDDFGTVLRAKGIVETEDGSWIEFDMVPEEVEIRETSPDYIGRICVIGADLNKEELARVFDR